MIFVKDLIWIGNLYDIDENNAYLNLIKKKYNINCIQFRNVEEGLNYIINSLKFKIVIVIINGDLFTSYINSINNHINELCSFPLSIIFTRNVSNYKLNCPSKNKLNDDFYNPGGVVDIFNPIMDYIKKFMKTEIKQIPVNMKQNPTNYEKCYSFEYIENGAQLIYPHLYNEIVNNKTIEENDIKKFNHFLVEKFSLSELIEPLTIIKNLNPIILSKFYVRAYSLESPFYRNLNWDLMMLNGENYFPFIKILYQGMQNYCFKDLSLKLYRGAKISENELNKLKKALNEKNIFENKIDDLLKMNKDTEIFDKKLIIPKILFYSRCFLSFSKSINVANSFSGNVILEMNLKYLDLKEIQSNSDISKFSAYSSEEEIVFYPFSSFSIEKIINENGKTRIILDCLGKYKESINEIMKNYKDNFEYFEKQLINSNFAKDVNNSKYIHLEDALQTIHYKMTGKPFVLEEYNNKKNEKKVKSQKEIIDNFIEEIFDWAINNIKH